MPVIKKKTKKVQKKPNDEVVLGIRCSRELRESFVERCTDMDTNASREVRNFMRSFLAQNGQSKLL